MSTQEHKQAAPNRVHCKVITVSDTRNKDTDKSGKLMMEKLAKSYQKDMPQKVCSAHFTNVTVLGIYGCKASKKFMHQS